ncbi:MAG: hypothetical protein WD801_09130 [Gemmatimonadaceae bacterium]
MERNDATNDLGTSAARNDGTEFTASGSPPTDANVDFSASTGSSEPSASVRDRAKHAIETAGDRLSGVGSTIRDRAGTAKVKLADALESGADRLRERGHADIPALAGVPGDGAAAVSMDGRQSQVTERVAGGMQASADWLREADLDSLKTSVEQQVREHPGRTLLIAAGVGYLIGRALRSNH